MCALRSHINLTLNNNNNNNNNNNIYIYIYMWGPTVPGTQTTLEEARPNI